MIIITLKNGRVYVPPMGQSSFTTGELGEVNKLLFIEVRGKDEETFHSTKIKNIEGTNSCTGKVARALRDALGIE